MMHFDAARECQAIYVDPAHAEIPAEDDKLDENSWDKCGDDQFTYEDFGARHKNFNFIGDKLRRARAKDNITKYAQAATSVSFIDECLLWSHKPGEKFQLKRSHKPINFIFN